MVLTDTVAAILAGGLNPDVDIIAGFNTNEGSAFVNDPAVTPPEKVAALISAVTQGGCLAKQTLALYAPNSTLYVGALSDDQTMNVAELKSQAVPCPHAAQVRRLS